MKARQQSRRASGLALASIVALAMGACLDDGTTLCASGLRCPTGYACTADGSGCRAENNLCGNGIVDGIGEVCDDGNVVSDDGCHELCVSDELCGNGFRDEDEACDDGRTLNGTEDSECDKNCQYECGNDVLREFEVCDENLFRVTCLDFGFDRGTLTCRKCAPENPGCGYIGWTLEDRLAGTGDLQGLWGDEAGDAFAVGEDESGNGNAILAYRLSRWGTDASGQDPGQLLDIWGSAPDDVFAVGRSGRALRYDGATWTELDSGADTQATLRGVWTAGKASDVIAVGDSATIVRYLRDTASWVSDPVPSSLPADAVLESVWGDGAADLYAVGHAAGRGVILRHTGQGWERDAPELLTPGLSDVWGTDGDVFAVGEDGVILHRARGSDGWSVMASSSTLALRSLWGSSADRVFAVGDRGTVLFYDGEQWSPLESATDLTLTAVWGIPGFGVAAAAENGRILRYHGWSRVPLPKRPEGGAIRSVWAEGLSDVYVLTEDVDAPQRFDGRTWTPMADGFAELDCLKSATSGGPSPLRHLWGRRPPKTEGEDTGAEIDGTDLYVAGDGNVIVRFRPGVGWSCMPIASPSPIHVHRVWNTDDRARDLFAVGEVVGEGRGVVLSYDGRAWKEMMRSDAPLRAIWGETSDELFVVGDAGTIWHYDEAVKPQWQQVPCELSNMESCGNLTAIWGRSRSNIHVVGENGLTLQFDGQGWSNHTVLSGEHLLDLWGTRSGQVFAVGANGSLFHHARGTWTPVHSGTDHELTSVWGVENPLGNPGVVMFGGDGATLGRLLINDDVLFGF